MYINVCIQTQVYAQNEELRTQLEQSKRQEFCLQRQISIAEQKFSKLHEMYDKLHGSENLESQLKVMQRKMQNVKSEFGSIDIIKLHWTEEVCV